jgi:DNA-binding NarL/FixJ family response regulator
MPSLLIADDHPLFRAALLRAVTDAVDDMTVSEADSFGGVVERLEAQELDLLLLDLHMPGNHGLAGLASIRALRPGLAIVIVSANSEISIIRRALDLGAAGYLPKSSSVADLREALLSVLNGERWAPPQLRAAVESASSAPGDVMLAKRVASLSAHQFRILGLVAEGLLNKQIADRMGIQLRTVKAHMTRIMERLGVRNRTQAVRILHELGLTEPTARIVEDA